MYVARAHHLSPAPRTTSRGEDMATRGNTREQQPESAARGSCALQSTHLNSDSVATRDFGSSTAVYRFFSAVKAPGSFGIKTTMRGDTGASKRPARLAAAPRGRSEAGHRSLARGAVARAPARPIAARVASVPAGRKGKGVQDPPNPSYMEIIFRSVIWGNT